MPRNVFERHGIKHLSASSLNLYKAQPSLWVGKYLLKWSDEVGPAAWRGSAVEAGLDRALMMPGEDRAVANQVALDRFELDAMGDASDKTQKERASIPDMIAQAVSAAAPWGMPIARQFQVEAWIDGIDVPLKGFVDYSYETFVADLKTTHRLPSSPQGNHAAQMAVYWRATAKEPRLLYATTKKHAIYPLTSEDLEPAWDDIRRAAFSLMYMLDKAEDGQDALRMFAPDFDSFYWADDTKAACVEAWGREIAA